MLCNNSNSLYSSTSCTSTTVSDSSSIWMKEIWKKLLKLFQCFSRVHQTANLLQGGQTWCNEIRQQKSKCRKRKSLRQSTRWLMKQRGTSSRRQRDTSVLDRYPRTKCEKLFHKLQRWRRKRDRNQTRSFDTKLFSAWCKVQGDNWWDSVARSIACPYRNKWKHRHNALYEHLFLGSLLQSRFHSKKLSRCTNFSCSY